MAGIMAFLSSGVVRRVIKGGLTNKLQIVSQAPYIRRCLSYCTLHLIYIHQ